MANGFGNGGLQRSAPWRMIGWGLAGCVLLAPLVAMRFTEEVNWTASDFVFAGLLLGSVGLGVELVVRRSGHPAYRAASVVALAAAFLLVWINAAVGIIGGEHQDANVLFIAVPAVALLGAVAARFRPVGMAWALAATALAQALVPVIASTFGPGVRALAWSPQVLVLSGFFAALWLSSAWLFRRAAT